jgi:hypothetical protein
MQRIWLALYAHDGTIAQALPISGALDAAAAHAQYLTLGHALANADPPPEGYVVALLLPDGSNPTHQFPTMSMLPQH